MYTSFYKIESSPFSWIIPSECIEKFGTLTFRNRLGTGRFGTAYDLCDTNSRCEKVVKVMQVSFQFTKGKFNEHVKLIFWK